MPTVTTVKFHGGPLDGQMRTCLPLDKYITQVIEHTDNEWWETFYVYRPVHRDNVCDIFYLHAVMRMHCDDTRH